MFSVVSQAASLKDCNIDFAVKALINDEYKKNDSIGPVYQSILAHHIQYYITQFDIQVYNT